MAEEKYYELASAGQFRAAANEANLIVLKAKRDDCR